jgi:hypothetical protein
VSRAHATAPATALRIRELDAGLQGMNFLKPIAFKNI